MSVAARVRAMQRRQRRIAELRATWPESAPGPPLPLLDFLPATTPGMVAPLHMASIAQKIERCLDDTVEICFSLPPRHGKTTLLVHAVAWILRLDPTATILYASYAHGFAAAQARKAMDIAASAGVVLGDIRRQDEWTTAAGGRVKAVGVGGQITGEGFRVIIVDDPHKNRAEAESSLVRDRVSAGFRNDIYTRQDPRGTSIFVVHTRWHQDDLIGQLTNPARDGGSWTYVNLPAISPANNVDGEEALAPWLFSLEKLRRLRSEVGPYGWASLFQGEPKPRSGRLFVDTCLVDSIDGAPGERYRYAIGVDLARTARTRSDYQCAVVMRRSLRTGLYDVVEVARWRGNLTDHVVGRRVESEGFIRTLHDLQRRYPGAPVRMYTGRDEDLLTKLMGTHDSFPVKIEAIAAVSDKWIRAQPFGGAWRAGKIRVPRFEPWTNDYVTEHVRFTGNDGDTDDQVDASATAYDVLSSGANASFEAAMGKVRRHG